MEATTTTQLLTLPALDEQMAHLAMIVWLFMVPVGILAVLLLYKVSRLLSAVLELVTVMRFDVYPMIKDLRALTGHTEALVGKLHTLADATEEAVATLKPKAQAGQQALWGWWQGLSRAGQVLSKELATLVGKS